MATSLWLQRPEFSAHRVLPQGDSLKGNHRWMAASRASKLSLPEEQTHGLGLPPPRAPAFDRGLWESQSALRELVTDGRSPTVAGYHIGCVSSTPPIGDGVSVYGYHVC